MLTAGATVVVAVALLVFDVPAVTAMAYAVVVVVTSVVLGADPAAGDHRRSAPAGPGRPGPAAPTPPAGRRCAAGPTSSPGRPRSLAGAPSCCWCWPSRCSGDLRLGPLTTPVPTDSTQYRAWELQSEEFAPARPTVLVVVEIPSGDSSAQSQVTTLVQDVAKADGWPP